METTNCTGTVTRMVTFDDIETDGAPGRYVNVDLTRCSACSGSAIVRDDDGSRWFLDIPADFPEDYTAAMWAAGVSAYRSPCYEGSMADKINESGPKPAAFLMGEEWTEDDEAAAEADHLAEIEADRAFGAALERRAEAGTWWGR